MRNIFEIGQVQNAIITLHCTDKTEKKELSMRALDVSPCFLMWHLAFNVSAKTGNVNFLKIFSLSSCSLYVSAGVAHNREDKIYGPALRSFISYLGCTPESPKPSRENLNDRQLPREMLPSLQGSTQCLPRDKRQAAGMYSFLPFRWYHKGWAGLQPVCKSCVHNFKQTLRRRQGRADSPGWVDTACPSTPQLPTGCPHTPLLSSAPSEGSHMARYFSNAFGFVFFFFGSSPRSCKVTVGNRRRHGFALGV